MPFWAGVRPSLVSTLDGSATEDGKILVALVYLDGIGIVSRAAGEHIEHAPTPQTLMNDAVGTLNLKKWKFFINCKGYPGHIVRPKNIEESTRMYDAVHLHEPASYLAEL